MKAILVIDLKADELPEDAHANVYVFGKYGEQEDDFVAFIGGVPLKPMPKMLNAWDYQQGWNDCIKEIEK